MRLRIYTKPTKGGLYDVQDIITATDVIKVTKIVSKKKSIVQQIEERMKDYQYELANKIDEHVFGSHGRIESEIIYEKPKFVFTGLWYTSKGNFVEVYGTVGFLLTDKGERICRVWLDDNGYFSHNGRIEALEIRKGPNDTTVGGRKQYSYSNEQMSKKEWPPCQTQF